MKEWLKLRSKAFSQEARDYGIEMPKGVLCVGPPGTGKSLFSKATASTFGVPLVKFDIGKVFGKFVGESEGRIRQAIKIIEAMAPCVLLVDEIDKGFGGLSGGGTDGGTSMRVLGSFLNWMQDRDCDAHPVFVVMTANNVQGLPPELMRRGRIDEIFACTFPGHDERKEIAGIHLKKRGHTLPPSQLDKVAAACDKYVGAEIEAAIKNALLDAFNEGLDHPKPEHIEKHLKEMVPLSKAFADKMQFMHEWAKNNAKPASSSMKFDDLAPAKDGVRPNPARKINVPGKGGIRGRSLDG
jgi:SpoVK/Ycf46/Vps4 family AAA+-type ATPase